MKSNTVNLHIENGEIETGKSIIKISIEGESSMPYTNSDLKVKAILALLNSMDIKDYYEDEQSEQGYKDAKEIIETAKATFGIM